MFKKYLVIVILFTFFPVFSRSCHGWPDKELAFGWQRSRPASGISLKLPMKDDYFLQPILAFSTMETESSAKGHFALGLRGIHNFTPRFDLQPYAGVSWGYSEKYSGKTVGDSKIAEGGAGYEAFFGIEYQKYLLRPSLEIGMGSLATWDQRYYAGVVCNFSLFYYF